jgi:hypothetical protein
VKVKTVKPIFTCILLCVLSFVLFGLSACVSLNNGYVLITQPLPGEGGTIQSSPQPNGDGKYSPGTRVRVEAILLGNPFLTRYE